MGLNNILRNLQLKYDENIHDLYLRKKIIDIISDTVGFCLYLQWKKISFFFFFFLAVPWCMKDISSWTKDQTHAPCIEHAESQPLDHYRSPITFKKKCDLLMYS